MAKGQVQHVDVCRKPNFPYQGEGATIAGDPELTGISDIFAKKGRA